MAERAFRRAAAWWALASTTVLPRVVVSLTVPEQRAVRQASVILTTPFATAKRELFSAIAARDEAADGLVAGGQFPPQPGPISPRSERREL